jgi:hypothetical protein
MVIFKVQSFYFKQLVQVKQLPAVIQQLQF